MKRHNLLPLATVVALCMSVTSTTVPLGALNFGAQTVYAGVVKRGASSKTAGTTSAATTDASSDANTTKQETSIGTAAFSDGKTYTEVDSNGQVSVICRMALRSMPSPPSMESPTQAIFIALVAATSKTSWSLIRSLMAMGAPASLRIL